MTMATGSALAQLAGGWTNAYKSKVRLWTMPTGLLFGTYESTAGATGKYMTYGLVDPALPAVAPGGGGQPMALLLNWRAIGSQGASDPSWNYVSGMSGQIICDPTGAPTLQLNHALIASQADGKTILPGAYVDRLQYDRVVGGPADADPPPTPDFPEPDNSLLVQWTTDQDPAVSLSFPWPFKGSTFVGTYRQGAQISAQMIATANGEYVQAPNSYLALAFNTFFDDPATGLATTVSYSGWIDVPNNRMRLQEYYSTGRGWDLRFFQSRGRTLYFTPV